MPSRYSLGESLGNKKEIICRYAGCDGYGNVLYSEEKLEENQEWCQEGITCNRRPDLNRDELGLYELEERQWLNVKLLEEWNRWLRSPYCQCTYSSGHRPTTGYCKSCRRPMTTESAVAMDSYSGIDSNGSERIRRMRAGPTWVPVYENIVRAAELALKLLVAATGPAPLNELPTVGRHNLRELWKKVPECAKDQVYAEIYGNHHFENVPHTITAKGEPLSDPLKLSEQPVFDKFEKEFDSVRYAWQNLGRYGLDEVNDRAKNWPDPINLYYLHFATEAALSVLERRLSDSEYRTGPWDRRIQMALSLDEMTYHTDWPHTYIEEEPIVIEVRAKPQEP